MNGELTPQEMEELLRTQVVGRIGCHAEGLTYVVPVSYAYDGEFVYGHAFEGMKIEMMRKNRNICFEVDNMQTISSWRSVIAWGEFEELIETEARNQALRLLLDRILPMVPSTISRMSPEWPFAPADLSSIRGIVYRLRLEKKSGKFQMNYVPSFLTGE